jgi:hypothetical protein
VKQDVKLYSTVHIYLFIAITRNDDDDDNNNNNKIQTAYYFPRYYLTIKEARGGAIG